MKEKLKAVWGGIGMPIVFHIISVLALLYLCVIWKNETAIWVFEFAFAFLFLITFLIGCLVCEKKLFFCISMLISHLVMCVIDPLIRIIVLDIYNTAEKSTIRQEEWNYLFEKMLSISNNIGMFMILALGTLCFIGKIICKKIH